MSSYRATLLFLHSAITQLLILCNSFNIITLIFIDILSVIIFIVVYNRLTVPYLIMQSGLSGFIWCSYSLGFNDFVIYGVLFKFGFFLQVHMLSGLYRNITPLLALYVGTSNLSILILLQVSSYHFSAPIIVSFIIGLFLLVHIFYWYYIGVIYDPERIMAISTSTSCLIIFMSSTFCLNVITVILLLLSWISLVAFIISYYQVSSFNKSTQIVLL